MTTTYNVPPSGSPYNPDHDDPCYALCVRVLTRIAPTIGATFDHMWTGGGCNYPGLDGPQSVQADTGWQILVSDTETGRPGVTTDDWPDGWQWEVRPDDELLVGMYDYDTDWTDHETCAQHDEALAAAVLALHARWQAAAWCPGCGQTIVTTDGKTECGGEGEGICCVVADDDDPCDWHPDGHDPDVVASARTAHDAAAT